MPNGEVDLRDPCGVANFETLAQDTARVCLRAKDPTFEQIHAYAIMRWNKDRMVGSFKVFFAQVSVLMSQEIDVTPPYYIHRKAHELASSAHGESEGQESFRTCTSCVEYERQVKGES